MNVLKHPVLVRFLATFAAATCCVDAFLLDWSAAVGSGLGSVSGGNSLMGFTFSISKKRVPLEDGFHNQGLQGARGGSSTDNRQQLRGDGQWMGLRGDQTERQLFVRGARASSSHGWHLIGSGPSRSRTPAKIDGEDHPSGSLPLRRIQAFGRPNIRIYGHIWEVSRFPVPFPVIESIK